jgi:hypothetical protein
MMRSMRHKYRKAVKSFEFSIEKLKQAESGTERCRSGEIDVKFGCSHSSGLTHDSDYRPRLPFVLVYGSPRSCPVIDTVDDRVGPDTAKVPTVLTGAFSGYEINIALKSQIAKAHLNPVKG